MLNKYSLHSNNHRARFRLLQSVSRLKQTDDFKALHALLLDAQTSIDKQNRSATSPQLEWGQGSAQFLGSLLDLIETSEKQAIDLRKRFEGKETP